MGNPTDRGIENFIHSMAGNAVKKLCKVRVNLIRVELEVKCKIFTSLSLMISPLVRQSFLLSSKTVFMFSIHTASTGPSNTYHFLSLVVLELPTRIMDDKMPSVLKTENT